MQGTQTAIAIFAKAPIEGFAKTRLIPLLGAEGAAALQARLIRRTAEIALEAKLGPVSIWCTPDCTHPVFADVADRFGVSVHLQAGPDLGVRLTNAMRYLTAECPALIIGTDCVAITPEHLERCAGSLRDGNDAVFLPVEDGGYILVGARKTIPGIFEDMPWTTERVMPETRRRAEELGLKIEEVEMLWDIDLPADYNRAVAMGAL